MVQVYVGLGANLGNREQTLRQALEALRQLAQGSVLCSEFLTTAAVGGPPQPDYLNAVAGFETTLAPTELLEALLAIELAHGRVREVKNGPRTLDLDLLWYGGQVIDQPGLQVPHPRICERRFVLEPWAQIAPTLVFDQVTLADRLQCLALA